MIRQYATVKWKWGETYVKGKVLKSYARRRTLVVDDTTIIRHGRLRNRALLIEQEDGHHVLKLESEVQKIES